MTAATIAWIDVERETRPPRNLLTWVLLAATIAMLYVLVR